MPCPVMIVETPRLPPRVVHKFKISHAGIVIPNFTAPPRAYVENVIECPFDDPAMTDSQNRILPVPFDQILNEKTYPGSKVHVGLATFDE